MGKAKEQRIQRRRNVRQQRLSCEDLLAPICDCCSLDFDNNNNNNNNNSGKEPSPSPATVVDGGEDHDDVDDDIDDDDVKDLVVIGAGPHAMALVLRLLQPNADLMSDAERHAKADHHASKIRPIPDVRRYCRSLSRGGTASIYRKKKKKNKKESSEIAYSDDLPPPVDLVRLRRSTLVLDRCPPPSPTAAASSFSSDNGESSSGWLSQWHANFDAIEIPHLRSPTNAHLDPFDYRSLDVFAEMNGRQEELVSLKHLKQRDKDFHGPYQAPSTRLFRDFHSTLGKAYGIEDMVQSSAEVVSIAPRSGSSSSSDEERSSDRDPYFEVHVRRATTSAVPGDVRDDDRDDDDYRPIVVVKAKRVVCALGPMFQTCAEFWERDLPAACRHRILHCHEIVPWILSQRKEDDDRGGGGGRRPLPPPEEKEEEDDRRRKSSSSLLIVGGGVTSAHLALLAARAPWCESVTLIQRSAVKERQFDIENKWMGPGRGKLLNRFWALDAPSKIRFLKETRRGGSIPPELVRRLLLLDDEERSVDGDRDGDGAMRRRKIRVRQEVQISDVSWDDDRDRFLVQLDDGSSAEGFDAIWLATGADNDVELYPCFERLMKDLPIDVVAGLPVLDSDLSWKRPSSSSPPPPENDDDPDDATVEEEEEEDPWKGVLRGRLHVMGSLAGLQLGPDALNLIGARHGAVRIAKAIRKAMNDGK